MSSPNRRACGESREGNGGGGVGQGCHTMEGKERKRWGWCGVGNWTVGPEWLLATWSKAAARARGGGGLANKGGQRGVGDVARHG
jgi:hypothetical protein